MLHPVVLAQLLMAGEVLEERSVLRETAPLRESVVLRARYERGGAEALLPRLSSHDPRPTVYLLGRSTPLTVRPSPQGWVVALPQVEHTPLRVVSSWEQPITGITRFQLRWPQWDEAATVRTRRVVSAPRDWIDRAPDGYRCPELTSDTMVCVTEDRHPAPVLTRVEPITASTATRLLALGMLALATAVVQSIARRDAARWLPAAGGAMVTAGLGLAWVGATVTSWGAVFATLVPLGMVVGAMVDDAPAARLLATVLLPTVPLLAALGVGAPLVTAVTLVGALAVFAAPSLTEPPQRP